jgi:RNA polymerase sigma-70 factor, ECF subfamily
MTEQALPEFSRIYDDYHARVRGCVSRLLGREEADDVTQEVFAKVARSLGTVAGPSRLASWIYAITLNTVRDVVRARASRVGRTAGEGTAGRNEPGHDELSNASDPGARTPEEIAIRREMVSCYLDFVDRLPPAQREVYVLAEFEGLSSEQIAGRLSVSVATAKIRLHRARAGLYEELRRNCKCYYNARGELMGEPKDP